MVKEGVRVEELIGPSALPESEALCGRAERVLAHSHLNGPELEPLEFGLASSI